MFGSVVLRKRNASVWDHLGRIEHAESKPRGHESLHSSVDLAFADQSALHCIDQRRVLATTGQIRSCFYREHGSFGFSLNELVAFPGISNGAAVRNDVTIKAPLAAQDISHELLVRTTRLFIRAVVRTHDRIGFGFN